MAELYGSIAGTRQWELDAIAAQQAQAETQRILGQVAMQPAQTKLVSAQADLAQEQVDSQRKMTQLMQENQGKFGASLGEQFNSLAQIAMKAGLVEEATKLSNAGSLIAQREQQTKNAEIEGRLNTLKSVKAEAELTSQLLGNATDEATWKEGNLKFEITTGRPSPYADLPYDADFVRRLNESAIDAKERADIGIKTETQKQDAAYKKRRLEQFDAANRLRELELALKRQAEERLKKAGGGKYVSTPTQPEIDQAGRLIKQVFPNFSSDYLYNEAFKLSSEANELRAQNKALGSDAALQQALKAAIERGEFKDEAKYKVGPVEIPGFRETVPKGPEMPAEAPPPGAQFPQIPKDKAEYKENTPYYSSRGLVRWDAKQGLFVEVPTITGDTDPVYKSLKSGEMYIGPDGQPRKKR